MILEEASKKITESDEQINEKSIIGKLLNEYAKTFLYGKNNVEINLGMAHYFFKLASNYGNVQSLYYSSIFSVLHLDGQFTLQENFDNLNPDYKFTYLRNHIENINSSSILINNYLASL